MIAEGRPGGFATDCDVRQVTSPSLGNEAEVDVERLASGCAMKVSRPPLATGCLSCVQMLGTHEAKVIQEVEPLEVRVTEARIAVEIAEHNGRRGSDEGGICRQTADQ